MSLYSVRSNASNSCDIEALLARQFAATGMTMNSSSNSNASSSSTSGSQITAPGQRGAASARISLAEQLVQEAMSTNPSSNSNASSSSSSNSQTTVVAQRVPAPPVPTNIRVLKEGEVLHKYLNHPIPKHREPLADQVQALEAQHKTALLLPELWALVFKYITDPELDALVAEINACTSDWSLKEHAGVIKQGLIKLYKWDRENVKITDLALTLGRNLHVKRIGNMLLRVSRCYEPYTHPLHRDCVSSIRESHLVHVDLNDLTRIQFPEDRFPDRDPEKPVSEIMPSYSVLYADNEGIYGKISIELQLSSSPPRDLYGTYRYEPRSR